MLKAMYKDMYKDFVRYLLRIAVKKDNIKKPIRALSRNRLLPASIWKRLPAEGMFPVVLPGGEAFFYVSTAKDQIGRALFWRGIDSWEAETIRVFYHLARNAEMVADVGANTGVYTLIALATNAESFVISFEPVDRVRERLLENIRVNGWSHRCAVLEEAVSNAPGIAKFHVPAGELPTSASLNPDGFRGYSGTLKDVNVTTIDEVMKEMEKRGIKRRLSLTKIDVEGFEDKVVKGMKRTIEKDKPNMIVEINPDGPFRELEELMSCYGYYFYHIQNSGPVLRDRIFPDSTERYRNWLFTAERIN
ncbi:MAG: FkbM family methyltransferase, partial [Actinomycetota bacterium]